MTLKELDKRFGELIQKQNKTKEDLEEKEKIGKELDEALTEDEYPLLIDLDDAGILVNSCWDLVNTGEKYPEAIPVLIEHLSKPYHPRNKEGIVRALTVKEAKGVACQAILEEYRKVPKDYKHFRWAFGNAMAKIMTKDYIDDVLEIVKDTKNGESRDMFVRAVGRYKDEKVREVMEMLKNDPDESIANEARKALKKYT